MVSDYVPVQQPVLPFVIRVHFFLAALTGCSQSTPHFEEGHEYHQQMSAILKITVYIVLERFFFLFCLTCYFLGHPFVKVAEIQLYLLIGFFNQPPRTSSTGAGKQNDFAVGGCAIIPFDFLFKINSCYTTLRTESPDFSIFEFAFVFHSIASNKHSTTVEFTTAEFSLVSAKCKLTLCRICYHMDFIKSNFIRNLNIVYLRNT